MNEEIEQTHSISSPLLSPLPQTTCLSAMNPMMHRSPVEASVTSQASGSSSHDHQKLDRASKLLTCLISKCGNEGYEPARLKASIGIVLFKYLMKYAPANSHYFNRDRLVTSGRYAGRWHDLFVHLIAAKGSGVLSTATPPCHSGQAVSSAIGQAIAMRNLAMLYNKPGLELLDNMIWCVIDDGRFQDSALETVALAGCWKLNNLCVIYDGTSESTPCVLDVAKLKNNGWNVIELVNDDELTVTALCMALGAARRSNVPTLINIEPSTSQRPPFPASDNTTHHLSLELHDFFQDVRNRSEVYEADWLVRLKTYRELYPALAKEFWDHVAGKRSSNPVKPAENPHTSTAAGPLTPPLSPWPADMNFRRAKQKTLRRERSPQQPSRRPTPHGAKQDTLHVRPCDAEEAAGAFLVSIRSTEMPTTISLPQNAAANFSGQSSRLGVTMGAYVFSKSQEDFDLTLITAGVGIHYAAGTRDFLLRECDLKARIVSCPCLKLFQLQTEAYKRSVLQPQCRKPTVAIDFGNSQGWEPYADALVSLEEVEKERNQPDRIGPRVNDFVKEFNNRQS